MTKFRTPIKFIACLTFALSLTACEKNKELKDEKPPELVLAPAAFSDLPKWGEDDFEGFTQSFARSCLRIMKHDKSEPFGVMGKDHKEAGSYGDWQAICKKFTHIEKPIQLKGFFEENFTPYKISADEDSEGLFTGYYEASLHGSTQKSERYNIPLHKRPSDLVMLNLGEFRESLKGARIAGRVQNGRLRPYESREEIVNGDWPHTSDRDVLLWVNDPVDAFFVQIQGSGLVEMEDGTRKRIGYNGQNGHVYYAIGRELVKRGELEKEKVSMQSIREWLEEHPDQADEIMNTNKSYVFFQEIDGEGPIGGEGVPLTARRSLAIDRTLISYGMPLWLSTQVQETSSFPAMTRMMVAQDTGGAIRGSVRGDVFWGYGEKAEASAGIMNTTGHYWVMLPKENIPKTLN